jgi:3-oxoacyl-[acyl-carrier protein] reductase
MSAVNFPALDGDLPCRPDRFGRINMRVNNAGMTRDKPLALMQEVDWQTVIETNLYGTINFSRAAVFAFMKQRSGRIVNITSVSGQMGLPGQTNYCASKAGIIGFTRALAKEVAKTGVTVNAVSPGFITTDMLEAMPAQLRSQMLSTAFHDSHGAVWAASGGCQSGEVSPV